MPSPVDPAGAAAAALNTQTVAVQRPPQPPVNITPDASVNDNRPADNANNIAATSRVDPSSRLGNFIDTTA